MQKYHTSMEGVGRRLTRLLALTLDLDPSYFDDKFNEPMLMLRLLHYSSVSQPHSNLSDDPVHLWWKRPCARACTDKAPFMGAERPPFDFPSHRPYRR